MTVVIDLEGEPGDGAFLYAWVAVTEDTVGIVSIDIGLGGPTPLVMQRRELAERMAPAPGRAPDGPGQDAPAPALRDGRGPLMLKAVMSGPRKDTGEHVHTILLGLSDENLRRVREGMPILVDGRDLEVPGVDVVIFSGRTEDSMKRMLEDQGFKMVEG